MAILGAASFGDEEYLFELHTSLAFAAFPVEEDDGIRFAASNQVGDAVLVYSELAGPLFEAVGPPLDFRQQAHAATPRTGAVQ